ncbi:MAG: anion permease [Halodesulfovibrio sp.]|uniref:anion permease n=1 Tax=Halodesulfovibrio sp. TaxID=1912772 RepID=UPI00359EE0D5
MFRYFFASTTAHTTALMPFFMVTATVLLPAEMIPQIALMLAGNISLMGVITPYAQGHPLSYGLGFISLARWWFLGAIFGALCFASMLILTALYVLQLHSKERPAFSCRSFFL